MFYGEYHHSLDNKDRVIIPSKFRDIFKENYSEKLFLTRGLDTCLFLFTEEAWKNHEKEYSAQPFTSRDNRHFSRFFFSGAADLTLGRQGRILIPSNLKKDANIKQDIVIIGISSRIEIWAKEEWGKFYEESVKDYEEVAERLFNKNTPQT